MHRQNLREKCILATEKIGDASQPADKLAADFAAAIMLAAPVIWWID